MPPINIKTAERTRFLYNLVDLFIIPLLSIGLSKSAIKDLKIELPVEKKYSILGLKFLNNTVV
jgi:hypothetical protein